CGQASTLMRCPDHTASPTRSTTLRSALMPHDSACRSSSRASLTSRGRQASRTASSSAVLRLISGPMPAGSPVAIAMTPAVRIRPALHPRHQRGVDHIRHAFAADRLDGEIDVLESELVGGYQLKREALGGQLLQRELTRLEAVAARAVHGNELYRELLEREV